MVNGRKYFHPYSLIHRWHYFVLAWSCFSLTFYYTSQPSHNLTKALCTTKIPRDKCPALTCDPDEMEFKVGNVVLMKTHTPTSACDTEYKLTFRIFKWIYDQSFAVQDNAWKVRHVSIQHLQLLYLAEYVSYTYLT